MNFGTALIILVSSLITGQVIAQEDYCAWKQEGLSIAEPLCGLAGDPERGQAIARDPYQGSCLTCHSLPVEGESFHGTLGPPLFGLGARYTAAQIRLRVVDERLINPMTIMPGFYRNPRLFNQVADDYWGKTMLSAQQIEDLVAWLSTLK